MQSVVSQWSMRGKCYLRQERAASHHHINEAETRPRQRIRAGKIDGKETESHFGAVHRKPLRLLMTPLASFHCLAIPSTKSLPSALSVLQTRQLTDSPCILPHAHRLCHIRCLGETLEPVAGRHNPR